MKENKFRACVSPKTVIYFDLSDLIHPARKNLFSKRELLIPWLLAGNKPDEYIGRKDKNGIEIYEGDITNYGIVEWCDCLNWDSGGSNHPGFYFKDKYGYERGDLEYHTGFDEYIEVVGNIYENPELSEEK